MGSGRACRFEVYFASNRDKLIWPFGQGTLKKKVSGVFGGYSGVNIVEMPCTLADHPHFRNPIVLSVCIPGHLRSTTLPVRLLPFGVWGEVGGVGMYFTYVMAYFIALVVVSTRTCNDVHLSIDNQWA